MWKQEEENRKEVKKRKIDFTEARKRKKKEREKWRVK